MERTPPIGPPTPPPEDEGDEDRPAEGTHLVDRISSELELLARNVEVLERLAGKPPMGIIRLSENLKLPIHKVRYSLHLLEREGVIQPSADGAVVTDRSREYWETLDRSLDRMNELIQQLKERTAAHRARLAPRKA